MSGKMECPLSPEDREAIQEIRSALNRVAESVDRDERITRAISSTLIGRVNGDLVDDRGGRIGRMEDDIRSLLRFREDMKVLLAKWAGGIIALGWLVNVLLPWLFKRI